MQEAGHAALAIIPSFKGFQGDLERGSSKAMLAAGTSGGTQFGDAAGKSAGSRFGSVFKTAAKASLVGVGALAVGAIKVGADSISQASDLNESLNAVNLSYEGQAKAVKKLGREAAVGLGLSNSEFNSLAVRFSSFSKTIAGGEGKKVTTTLDDLTTRASDFASVMNLEVNEAAQLFQSGLAGETEPLRAYGLDLSAAKVEAFALSTGIVKNKDDLTESAKVQARYALLMKDTSQTQGDFAGTSDELANSQRILGARWDNAQAKLGKGLLPIMKDAVGFVNKEGIPAFLDFSDWFTKDGIPAIQGFITEVRPLANKILPAAASAFDTIRDSAKAALPYAEDLVDAFNDMPDWAKKALVGGTAAGFAANKLLPKGAPGALASAVGLAKPIPVFVTNPGFGGPDVTPDGKPGTKASKLLKYGPQVAAVAGIGYFGAQGIKSGVDGVKNATSSPSGGFFNPSGLSMMSRGESGSTTPMSKDDWARTLELRAKINGTTIKAEQSQVALNEAIKDGYEKGLTATESIKRFNEATRNGKRTTDRLRESMEKVGAARVRPEVDTSSIETALALFRQLPQMAGVVGPVDPALLTPRAGININVANLHATDVKDITRQAQRKAQQANLGGRPGP